MQILNDGRADFATNPFSGPAPTFEQFLASGFRRSLSTSLSAPNSRLPMSYQSSIGIQRQLGDTISVEADYVDTRSRNELNSRNVNLSYNPATGANYAIHGRVAAALPRVEHRQHPVHRRTVELPRAADGVH